jgi:hypothetical protein
MLEGQKVLRTKNRKKRHKKGKKTLAEDEEGVGTCRG